MLCFVDLFALQTPTSAEASSASESGQSTDALAFIGNYPLRRQALRTSEISGNLVVEAVKIEYLGEARIIFPFPVRRFHFTSLHHHDHLHSDSACIDHIDH